MTDIRYWLWLQMCLGEGARFREMLEDFGSVEALYKSNILEWRMSPSITSKQVELLGRYSLDDTEHIIYNCESNGWTIIGYDNPLYPQRLREIPNPPAVLYVDGEMPDFDSLVAIAIVGTRKASPYAKRCARIMSKGISLCNAVTVSGAALGVDSAAHKGAIEIKRKTYAVLGCGLGTNYLNENRHLREKIKECGGALITEYPPFTNASKYTFPMRNRIISGLSLGVLVIEAGVKSGSLITAKYAYEQGRDVYAVPASIFDYNFYGTNKLIEDGATVATSPSVLLEGYAERYDSVDLSQLKTVKELTQIISDSSANAPTPEQTTFDNIARDRAEEVRRDSVALTLKGNEKTVYDNLTDCFETIDNIIEKCQIESKQVLAALTMLEMKGLVESTSGKRYKLK